MKARSRVKRITPRRIIGIDGEGQDIFECKRCQTRVPASGGECPRGGQHLLTFGCERCGAVDPENGSRCGASEGGEHKLAVLADGHIYTYLAAVDEHGRLVAEAYNPNGLTHDECAEMILSIPRNTLAFGFMFSYDVTKIIEQMPPEKRYYLMRPKAREMVVCKKRSCKAELPRNAVKCDVCGSKKVRKATRTVEWNGRTYDFFHGSLTISASKDGRPCSRKIWDCFRFYGTSFVNSLIDWSSCKRRGCGGGNPGLLRRLPEDRGYVCLTCGEGLEEGEEPPVATADEIETIAAMKDKRGSFDVEDPEDVKRYCRMECRLLARALRRLIDSHDRAGIPLKRYDGAGSTATALLRKNEVAEFKGPSLRDLDPDLAHAIACAFAGGRFEDSMVGAVREPCHGFDISSAYPYALTFLPCLVCGFWRLEKRMTPAKLARIHAKNGLAVARFHVRHVEDEERRKIAWCPLPFRSDKGSITYGTNFSGWAWAPELLAALRGWPDLVALGGEAWVYERKCDHQPFAFLPDVYRQRLGWGKEGAGKVLKLGMNACVTGDTRVATAVGNVPIADLVGAGVEVVGGDGELHHAGAVVSVGEREVWRLRTRLGRELRLTADHLVYTQNRGDVRAWELTPDDEIAVSGGGIDRLASFAVAGVAEVFDLTEVDTRHFIANGIVVHNSYGKTAQSIGDDPPFQSWIWAGVVTATTRGQLLDAIASAKDRWNILAVATDGVYTTEMLPIKAPPKDTGTADLGKPLGGWEHKPVPEGIFIAKPGMYWSLTMEFVRARGIGRRELKECFQAVEKAFAAWDRQDMDYSVVVRSRRFFGAKSSILGRSACTECKPSKTWPGVPEYRCPACKRVGSRFDVALMKTERGRDAYGTWDLRTIKVAFDPWPKRERTGIGRGGTYGRLHVRDLDGATSAPYDIGTRKTTPEGEASRASKEFELEQPEWNA